MALAWGISSRRGRGPKPALDLPAIVQAGVDIAVTDGLTAVSMARVAAKIDASTMSLYRYVPSKKDLLELMVDAALDRPPSLPAGATWRSGLLLWANELAARYRAHPWALQVPISGPPLGPNNVRWLESGLAALGGARLTDPQKFSAVLTVSAYVRGVESIAAGIRSNVALSGRQPDDYGEMLAHLIDPAHFPQLHRAIGVGALRDEDPSDIGIDDELSFGLERILDGVGALIRSNGSRRST